MEVRENYVEISQVKQIFTKTIWQYLHCLQKLFAFCFIFEPFFTFQAASPSLLSDMEELSVPEPLPGPNDVETGPPSDPSADETESKILDEEEEDADNVMLDELSRSSSPDSMVLAIDEAINILDPPRARVSRLL